MELAEAAVHLIALTVYIALFIPVYYGYRGFSGFGLITRPLRIIVLAGLPIVLFHTAEALSALGSPVVPPEGTFEHLVIEHTATGATLAILAYGVWRLKRLFLPKRPEAPEEIR